MLQALASEIDGCFCINLRERTDRREEAQACFDKLGLTVEFHTAERHPHGGVEGCYREHNAICKKALERGYNRALIAEDDLSVLEEPSPRALHEVIQFLKRDDWDILFLGTAPCIGNEKTRRVKDYVHILQVHALQAHCYIVSQRFMKKFVSLQYDFFSQPVDVIYSMLNTAYAVFPTWFYQTDSKSNIDTNRILTFTNGMRRALYKAKVGYARYVNVPLYWVFLAFAIGFFVLSVCLLVACARR